MNDPTTSIYLRNARRQIRHALSTRKEHDRYLYGAIYQLIGHRCHLATIEDDQRVAFYCDPQGILNFDMELSRSQREGFNDPDYVPPVSSVSANRGRRDDVDAIAERGDAAEVGEDATEGGEAEDKDEEEEEEKDEGDGDNEDEGEDEEEQGQAAGRPRAARDIELGTRLPLRHPPAPANTTASSAGATASTASTMFNHSIARYPDYRLVKAYLDDQDDERVRYNLAIVEVKILCAPEDPQSKDNVVEAVESERRDVNDVARSMLPQVIQAMQVIFAKHESYQEVVVIPVVNEYCKFMYFRRTDVPPFSITNLDPRGYQEPGGLVGKALAEKLQTYAYRISGKMIKMVYGMEAGGRRLTFGQAFIEQWEEFLNWTKRNELFPEQPEGL